MCENSPNIPLVTLLVGIVMTGCIQMRAASPITVQFDDTVEGLQKGDHVYLLGVLIGQIDAPVIVNGRPSIPVELRDNDVFGKDRQVLFYIAPDPARPGHQSLAAIIRSTPAEPNQPRFTGFTSKTKLMLQLGAEKAASWWNSLNK